MSENKHGFGLINSVIVLRVLIGWHFLYEGIIKMYNPEWTAFGYLSSAQGPLKGFFVSLTSDSIINWVDPLNIVALLIVGLTFTLGFLEKKGAIVAILLLAAYYLAYPPLPWLTQYNTEGNYWFVNKNLIELAACLVIYNLPTGSYFGLNRIFENQKKKIKN